MKIIPLSLMAVVSAETNQGFVRKLYDTKGSAGLKKTCHKYFQQSPSSAVRNGGGQEPRGQQSACRHKISKIEDGMKVEVSPCLDPYAPRKYRGMPNPQGFGKSSERSRTGTNGHVHLGDNSVEEFYLDNNQLRELLQLEKTWETDSIFVIKDCGTMDERHIHQVHHHIHHVHHHHIENRHLRQEQPERMYETHYMFYTLVSLGVALVVSLNVGGTRRGDVPYAEAGQPEVVPVVPPENVILLNIDEPCAVPI